MHQTFISMIVGSATAIGSAPIPAQQIVITSNCAACFGVEKLAIKTTSGRMRDVLPRDFTNNPIQQVIGYVHSPKKAAIPGRIAKDHATLGPGPEGGSDVRYVSAIDGALVSTFYQPAQWRVEAKGLRARTGATLNDSFVLHGFCEGNMYRLPRWQLHGADDRPLEPSQSGGSVIPTNELGAAEIRESLSLQPNPLSATICMGRLTAPKDFYTILLRDRLQNDLRKMEDAFAPSSIVEHVRSALAEVLKSDVGRALVREAVDQAIVVPGSPPAAPVKPTRQ